MNTIQIPMYRVNGAPIQLFELLEKVSENGLIWAILEFDGVGIMPKEMSFAAFQQLLRESPNGLTMPWNELVQFAKTLEYTIDCLIVAVKNADDIKKSQLFLDDFRSCEVYLRAFDSTDWFLGAADKNLLQLLIKEVIAKPAV